MTTFQSILAADALGFAMSIAIGLIVWLVRRKKSKDLIYGPPPDRFCTHCIHCHRNTRPLNGPCITRGFCDACKTVLHARS